MNKKLLAVAIAAAISAPAAFAASHGGSNTTLYGKVHMSINNSGDQGGVDSHSSRIGVKGSESLSNGLKAIFKMELAANGYDGGTFGGARNNYIGLSGGFGTFVLGRHDTPAKVAFYAAGNERLGDSIIDLNSNFGFSEFRTNNAIAYISPNFSGVKIAAAIVPGEGAVATADGYADSYSVGVMYKGNGVKAGLGYTDLGLGATADASLMNLGVSATFGAFSVGGQYQNIDGTGTGIIERTAWALTGTAKFGANQVIAMYGSAEDDNTANSDVDTFGLALKHTMSKRTSVYVAYRGDDNKTALGNAWVGNGGSTQTQDAFAIGMIHTF